MGIKNRVKAWSTAAMCGLAVCIAAPANAAIQDDLIGLWQMDVSSGGTATDLINSNDGSWQNGASNNLGWVAGQVGNAADLQGNNDNTNNRFDVGTITQFTGATTMTFATWIQPDTQTDTAYNGIFMSRTQNWGLAYESNNHTDNRTATAVSSTGSPDSTNIILPNGSWYHVAFTYDVNTSAKNVYVNGVLNQSAPMVGVVPTASAQFAIGMDGMGPTQARDFDGRIDDLSLWTRDLSAAEMKTVYDRGQESISAARAFSTINEGIQQGMIAHWSLDQAAFSTTAYDSKNNNDGALTNTAPGNASTAWVDGKIGGAFDFNGSGDYIKTGTDIGDGASALTMSVWVNLDAKTNWDGFLTSKGDFFGLQVDGDGGKDAHFRAMGVPFYSDVELNTGEWYHLVGVWESGVTQQLYVNGVAVAAATGTGVVAGGTIDVDEWIIGRDRELGNDGGRYADGLIDDAVLWTRALSATEIASLYHSGNAGLNAQQAIPTPAAGVAGLVMLGLIGSRRRSRA